MALRLISFDPLRTLGIPGVGHIKPGNFLEHLPALNAADWVLFPDYWQVNVLYHVLRCRVFPSVASYYLGHTKVEQTRALQAVFPAHIPDTHIAANTDSQRQAILDHFTFPFVAKHIKASEGRGVFLIQNRDDWQRYVADAEVLYAQEYLPINRDLRVVYIGDRVVAAYWRGMSSDGFHTNISRGGKLDVEDVPAEALALTAAIAVRLGIDHAGFDLCCVDGHWYVLEFNRLLGNIGLRELGVDVASTIYQYLLAQSSTPRS